MSDAVLVDDPAPSASGDSTAAFGSSLRDLRRAAGNPTLAALSAHTGISKSVISVAFSGRGLPTERTVVELVRELGGDENEWRLRRDALDPRKLSPLLDPAVPGDARRRFTLLQVGIIAVAAIAISSVVTSLIWGAVSPHESARAGAPENAEGPYLAAANGVDPMRTACKEDAVIAADEARFNNEVHMQLLYSNNCLAVWGRVTRYDGKSGGNTMTMRIWPANDPESKRNQSRSDKDLQSLYTPMIIEPDVEARICGVATITADGKTVELGPPLCV